MATFFPKRRDHHLHMAAQPGLLSIPKDNSGACKVSQPSHGQGEAVVTPAQMRPGSTAAWICRDVFVPGWHQRWPETDGKTPQWGGTRVWAAVGMEQGWWLQTRAKMSPRWVVGGTGTSGLRAGEWVQCPAGGLGSAPPQLLQPEPPPFFRQAGWGRSLTHSISPSRFP